MSIDNNIMYTENFASIAIVADFLLTTWISVQQLLCEFSANSAANQLALFEACNVILYVE